MLLTGILHGLFKLFSPASMTMTYGLRQLSFPLTSIWTTYLEVVVQVGQAARDWTSDLCQTTILCRSTQERTLWNLHPTQ